MKTKIITLIAALLLCSSLRAQVYDVADAIAAANAGTIQTGDSIVVRGVITKLESRGNIFAKYGSVNIYVQDITGAEGEFEFYNCYSLNADTFKTSTPAYDAESTAWTLFDAVSDGNGNTINVGDIVIAQGKYKLFNTTHELEQRCYLTNIINNHYTITYACNTSMGYITGPHRTSRNYTITFTAEPNYGYHFTQWSDGVMDNPRTAVIVKDTTFTAEFTHNTYSIRTESSNNEWGIVAGDTTALYLDQVEISAAANYGYHFVCWNDGNNVNPRNVVVTQDSTYTATFAKNKYIITMIANSSQGTISGLSQAEYLDSVTLIANPKYGYYFSQWSDGNTDNPRTIIVTQDTILTAEFTPYERNIIVVSGTPQLGDVTGSGVYPYNSTIEISAFATKYGYTFDYWDDNTLLLDSAITVAEAIQIASALGYNEQTPIKYKVHGYITRNYSNYTNSYYLADSPNTSSSFIIYRASNSAKIGDEIVVEAYLYNYNGNTPETYQAGYITKLAPKNYSNPRNITVTEDKTFVAYFKLDQYNLTLVENENGELFGNGTFEYMSSATIEVVPNYGYHFVQWSDGNTDNPRIITITQDSTLTAELAPDKSGICGTDNALKWSYEDQSKTLTISGSGALNENYTFGVEAPTQMQTLVIGNNITSIGDSAFYARTTINHLSIGANVASIGNYTFAESKNFDDITCYATTVPTINATTFANVGNKYYIYLFVPEDRERAYKRDTYWSQFDVQIMKGTTTTTDNLMVTSEDNTADVIWPEVSGAASYELVIKDKNGNIVCTLVFNANGQLVSIVFNAPACEKSAETEQVAGFSFTVTGLEEGETYNLTITAKDDNDNVLDVKSMSFVAGGGEQQDIENIVIPSDKCNKVLHDGQIFILRGEKVYTLTGQEVQ